MLWGVVKKDGLGILAEAYDVLSHKGVWDPWGSSIREK